MTINGMIAEREGKAICPACKGVGRIQPPRSSETSERALKEAAAITLLEAGYGIRQTQRLLGYKSANSVQRIKTLRPERRTT